MTRILYFGVFDDSYPRNSRIRSYLERTYGADIEIVAGLGRGSYLRRYGRPLLAGLSKRGRFEVVILAEFALHYAPWSWFLSRRHRALHVVDFFVGNYETKVEDWAYVSGRSLRGLIQHAVDAFALWSADVVLTDTEPRARRFARQKSVRGAPVVDLPVGAPEWAQVDPCVSRGSGPLRVLYYGSYLPLHGVQALLEGIRRAQNEVAIDILMVGGGGLRSEIEAAVAGSSFVTRPAFRDAVDPRELRELLVHADVVAGIFGISEKAAEVVANKVWQGLAANKYVITRTSAALDSLEAVAGGRLIVVPPGDPEEISRALRKLSGALAVGDLDLVSDLRPALDAYVDGRFRDVFDSTGLDEMLGR